MPSDPRPPIRRQALRLALGIGALYAALGFAWILSSDALVTAMAGDADWLAAAQRYKGLFYVAFTALGLVLLVHVGYSRLLRADATARAHELQVRDMFLRHPQPMWVVDPDTLAFLKVNDAAVGHYGYSEAEFLGMTLDEIRPTEDIPAQRAATHPAPQDGATVSRARHRTRSGELIHVSVAAHVVPYAGRTAVLAMAMDITHEVRAARALERQEAQFRQLHQSLGEVLWLASASGAELLYVSPAFEPVYGRPATEFQRDPGLWLALVHEDDRATAQASNRQLAETGQSRCEYRIRRPDGTLRWIADRKKAIVDPEGLVSMIGGIAEDITASKELEAARAGAREDLERKVAERTAELKRVNAELDAFTRTAAHDLKSPLNGVVGLAHLLQARHASALGDEGIRMARRIGQSAQQMAALVNDLMSLSRASTTALQLAWVDLAPLSREVAEELGRQEPQRRVDFDAPPTLRAWCDPGLARSLVANLVGNAWKFTAERSPGVIRLSAREADGLLVVRVEDNGAGFDALGAPGLFEPFQRFHAPAQFAGSGVGLATCRRIVQRHGGHIWIDSAPGQGTTVSFALPVPLPASNEAPAAGAMAA